MMSWLLNTSFAQDIGMTLVHSLWQILLVAVVFVVANRFLTRRSANLRYVVAYAALVLMLGLPLVTLFAVFGQTATFWEPAVDSPQQLENSFFDAATNDGIDVYATSDVSTLPTESMEVLHIATTEFARPTAIETESAPGLSRILPWLSVAWSLGVVAFSLRPFVALYRCHRIRKQAQPITLTWIDETLESLSKRIGLKRKVEIACSALVHVPTVMGFIRPIILLPLSMISGQTQHELSAIIAHELAHIRRHDFVLNLFQTAIETLLFYHPAAWWVTSVVRQERENCCDDIAMSVCGRKNYATALANLEFARSAQPSLAMAADGGSLYRRIHRIVRPHEIPNPLGRWLAALIALSALLLGIIAVLSPGVDAAAADAQPDAQEAIVDTPLSERFPNDEIKIQGRVVAPDGKPVSDANVHALRWYWRDATEQRPLATTTTKSDGTFTISYRKSQIDKDIGKPEQWKQTWLVATAKNFGLGQMNLSDVQPAESNVVQLVDDQVVSGQVLDLEGSPVANAVIRPVRMDMAKVGSIDGFTKAVREGKSAPDAFRKHLGKMNQLTCLPDFANIRTDVDGRFQLQGLGKDRVVYVTCSGENVATTEFIAVTKPMSSFTIPTEGLAPNATGIMFGSDVKLTVAPTQIVKGTVLDAETRGALAGVSVRVGQGRTQCQTRTDSDGNYRLVGLTKAKSYNVAFVAAADQPYFNRTEKVTAAEGFSETQLDAELFRGEWISGQVTDEQGKGVLARVRYVPYKDNPHAEHIGQFRQGRRNDRSRNTSLDGSYRILAIHGHALLGVWAMSPDEFRSGVGAEQVSGFDPNDDLSPSLSLYSVLGVKSLHAFQELGPETTFDAGEDFNFQLESLEEDAVASDKTIAIAAKQMGDSPPDNGIRTYAGNVLDATGRPVAGAKVYAENTAYNRQLKRQISKELQSTYSAADGSYSITFRPQDGNNQLIVTKEGYGPAIANYGVLHKLWKQGKSELDMRLGGVKAINGRVVDTEGNPIGGISVHVDEIALPQSEEAVEKWIANEQPELFARRDRRSVMMSHDTRVTSTSFPVAMVASSGSVIPADVTTSEDGGFQLAGLAENCRVRLILSGPTIAKRRAIVVTRQMKNVTAFAHRVRNGEFTHYGASPTLIASPTQPIFGRIVDAKTKRPLPNIPVHLARAGKEQWFGADQVTDTTDVDGRFELLGAPLGGEHRVEVHPSLELPYFETKRELPVTSGSAPLECDFELPPTSWVRGRVTDESGKPVVATLEFYPYRDNPNADTFTKYDPQISGSVPDDKVHTDERGNFRIKAIPGRAVLAAVAKDRKVRLNYLPNSDDELIERIGGQEMRKVYNGWSADYFDALVEVTVSVDGDELIQNLTLKLGRTRTLNITSDAGHEWSEIMALGRTFPPNRRLEPIENSRLEIIGLKPSESRIVVLLHEQRQLGKVLKVSGAESEPIAVRLLPCATVTGRVIDRDGEGVKNLSVRITSIQEPKTDSWSRELNEATTDTDGRFRLLLPSGGAFRIFAYSDVGPNFSARIRPTAGATYDLGELKHNDELEESDTQKLAQDKHEVPGKVSANAKQDMANSLTYSGKVTNKDGSPAVDAQVAIIATELDGQVWREAKALAETTADAAGRFLIRLEGISEKTHTNAHLVMRSEGSGIAWKKLDLTQTEQKALGETTLRPSKPIQCRLIDLEGRPAAILEVKVDAIVVPAKDEERMEWLPFFSLQQPPKAWVQRMRTDQDGLLTIPNIPVGHGVHLKVLPTDEFAPQHIALNTGMAEERGERDGTYRSIVKNMKPGEVANIPLSPATIFEGVVRLEDTGEPAANCKIEIWASQENSGSMAVVFDKTDDRGRFRLNPNPGVRFGITAHPPDGTPYQIKRLGDLGEGIRWKSGDESKNITIELTRGAVATGRIVDAKSGEPIANAAVEYRPMGTNPNDTDDIITGWKGTKKTNEQGEFRISVLPGEGWLLVHANSRDYVLQEKTGRQLTYDKPGGRRIYAHAFVKIKPTKDEVNMGQVKLTPARTVTLEVVDPDGKPIAEGLAISRLHVSVHAGRWEGQSMDVIKDGQVEIGGVGEGVDYPIYLLDPKRKLGAVATINARRSTQKVTLQTCGSAVMRYVNQQGKPLAGRGMEFHMVVTPGVNHFDYDAMRNDGAVAADQDFVANIDRRNHGKNNRSGDDGRLVLSALIPGATYRHASGQRNKLNEFVAKSGEVRELGQIVIDDDSDK